jgi:ATP-dependent helicase/nuclease subunit B
MLRQGAFGGVAAGASISTIAYVALRGGEPPGAAEPITFKEGTPDEHADRALARLKAVLARFENQQEPYRSLVSPMWKTRYGDYDHLARVKEWSAGAEEDEE